MLSKEISDNPYRVIQSNPPEVKRNTLDDGERSRLEDLLTGTELLLKQNMRGVKETNVVLDATKRSFVDWFRDVVNEDKGKVGTLWGNAGQVAIDYGCGTVDNHTIWRFSWNNIQVWHAARKTIYPKDNPHKPIDDREKWLAEIDTNRNRVVTFGYQSTRQLAHWDTRQNKNSDKPLINRTLKLDFDGEGDLREMTYSRNIELPTQIYGKGSEIIRTWQIGRGTS